MPFRRVPGGDSGYFLTIFDEDGVERREADGTFMTERVLDELDAGPTDVFIFSHGWKGDIPAACEQYDRWVAAMAGAREDIARVEATRPAFKPLLVGLHWPSLPFGDEDVVGPSFTTPIGIPAGVTDLVETMVDTYAHRIADTPRARAALRVILSAAALQGSPPTLPEDVRDAYVALDAEAGLGCDGEAGTPGHDREPFDAEDAFQRGLDAEGDPLVSFGGLPGASALLSPLRQLSFWKMKDRARSFGESGAHALLRRLQQRASASIRFHVMGHSFGCIVASALVSGPPGSEPMRPIDTLLLVQGALSIWSYASDIPSRTGTQGYFRSIIAGSKVKGVMVTTQSEGDTAVGRLYPLAAGMRRQVEYPAPGEFPKYGALGAFGVQGAGCNAIARRMAAVGRSNGFSAGRVFNVDSSAYIAGGGGLSGSHNNIDRPEVAHVFWDAVNVQA